MTTNHFSRRKFLALSAGVPALLRAAGGAQRAGASGKIPVGLELFSVRESLKRDQDATLIAVAKTCYQCV